MKPLVLLSLCVSCVYCTDDIPTVPGDNSHYVEGKSRYIWMPDGEGDPRLADLQGLVEENILNTRNGANNQYWLFTRQNPLNYQLIVHGDANTIRASNYQSSRPIKVIVHGWYGNGSADMNTLITDAFLTAQDCNVIVVDWAAVATNKYITSVKGVPSVGQHLGKFLTWLIDTAGGIWENMHMVGFSLGAHVVGVAGRTANGWPARVTGLDPAAPGWILNKNALNTSSGEHVEVIHTDGGLAGILHPIADADFYPNAGKNPQPGCRLSICSHERSFQLFAATIYHEHLVGKLCSNIWEAEFSSCSGTLLKMGSAIVSKQGKGMYGLRTKNTWPF